MKSDFLPVNVEWLTDYCKNAFIQKESWADSIKGLKFWEGWKENPTFTLIFPADQCLCEFAWELWAIYCIMHCFLSLFLKAPVVPFTLKI